MPCLSKNGIYVGDSLALLERLADDSVDLIVTSPPYEDARTYGIDCKLKGEEWVDWALVRYLECVRVCRGLVVWVVEGRTRQFRWSATPALLMADLHRAGVKLRKPPVYYRSGIPGSGGPDWLRNDWEFCICSSKGRLPWSDSTAMGEPPKWNPGGPPTHRKKNGDRVNVVSAKEVKDSVEPKVAAAMAGEIAGKLHTKSDGDKMRVQCYTPPEIANPGNIIRCTVGKGRMGHDLYHENEAPYPEYLPEFFIRSFCPPDGLVLDPFCGSGTTLCVAKALGRSYIGFDVRQSQKELSEKRLADPTYQDWPKSLHKEGENG